MLKIEFHSHTMMSVDSLQTPRQLIHAARRKGLDRVVITDHNSIKGALAAKQLDPELIIVGEEIQTSEGELLVAFLTEEIPAGLEPKDTIDRLRAQNAFISVSHPFDKTRSGWKMATLIDLVPHLDAIEILNARCMTVRQNQLAIEFAHEYHLPGTAGSDAHLSWELGKAMMELPDFVDSDTLRTAIQHASLHGKISPYWVHFGSMYARFYKKLFTHKSETF